MNRWDDVCDFRRKPRLAAAEFVAGDQSQLEQLRRMGIRALTMADGRVQLLQVSFVWKFIIICQNLLVDISLDIEWRALIKPPKWR